MKLFVNDYLYHMPVYLGLNDVTHKFLVYYTLTVDAHGQAQATFWYNCWYH